MPFVKVPGTDREIWIDLHEPEEPGAPLFPALGKYLQLTPEQFAAGMKDTASNWNFTPPFMASVPIHTQAEVEKSARRFQKYRVPRGRPFAHTFSRAEDFAVMVIYFESRGYKKSTKETIFYWIRNNQVCPTARQIQEALKVVRGWVFVDLEHTVQSIRKKYRLAGALPRKLKKLI